MQNIFVGVCRNASIILLAHLLLKKTDWWLTKKGWNTRQQMLFRLTWANIQNLLWSVLAILENICLFCVGKYIGRDYLNVKYVCTEKGNVIRKLSKQVAKEAWEFLALERKKINSICWQIVIIDLTLFIDNIQVFQ